RSIPTWKQARRPHEEQTTRGMPDSKAGTFFFSSRRRHTRWPRDWSSDVCSSDLHEQEMQFAAREREAIAARQVQHQEELGLLGVRLDLLAREEEGLRLEQQRLLDSSAEDEARQKQAEDTLEKALQEIHDAQHGV